MESLPKWARGVLKNHDPERVSKAVHKAEARCAGEFVVCVARRSSSVAQSGTVAALVLFAIFLMASSLWGKTGDYGSPLMVWLLAAGLAALLGHFVGQHPFIQRLLSFPHERSLFVHRRAELEFHQNHLEKTSGATGVLIFISLMERQAVLLADKSIASKLPEEAWEPVLKKILLGVKQGDLGAGLVAALDASAALVASHFPRKVNEKNQLSDRLLIKE